MEQYISKAALLDELNRLYDLEYNNISVLSCGKKIMLRHILIFLNTLEVKDLQTSDIEKFNEKIYDDGITWLFGHHCLECEHLTFAQHEVKELAKYFYELGLKTQKGDNLP